ncbi:MAG: tripartite tricarboxylate transporter substrate binding protein [Comamonadaceae bacterium]|nr:tripartite tricarboxylate transporter substrate binding protein [Comamonadaceae bacterium]
MHPSSIRRRQLLAWGAIAPMLGWGHVSLAQTTWPSKIIKIIVAFPAGGPTDTVARIMAHKLGQRLGQQIIIENKPGASGSIGTAALINSPADGHHLSMFGMPALLAPLMYKSDAYDVTRDFAAVAAIYDLPMAIIINPAVIERVDDLPGLIRFIKTSEQPLSFTSAGTGSFGHLAMEQLKSMGQFELMHVPYRGSAPAVADLLGGQVGIMFADVVSALPYIRNGKLKAIALSSPNAKALLPNAGTISEQGFAGFDFDSWGGLIAPLGTPQAIIDRIANETSQIVSQDEELRQKLLSVGAIASFQDGKHMHERLKKDFARWSAIAQEKGISAV